MNRTMKILPMIIILFSLGSCGLVDDPSYKDGGNPSISSGEVIDEDSLEQILGVGLNLTSKGKEGDTYPQKEYKNYYSYIDGADIPEDEDYSCFINSRFSIHLSDKLDTEEYTSDIYLDPDICNSYIAIYAYSYSKENGMSTDLIQLLDLCTDFQISSISYAIENTYQTGKVKKYTLTLNFNIIDTLQSLDVMEFSEDDTVNKKTTITKDTLASEFKFDSKTSYAFVKSHFQKKDLTTYTEMSPIMTYSSTENYSFQPMFSSSLGIVDCSGINFHY